MALAKSYESVAEYSDALERESFQRVWGNVLLMVLAGGGFFLSELLFKNLFLFFLCGALFLVGLLRLASSLKLAAEVNDKLIGLSGVQELSKLQLAELLLREAPEEAEELAFGGEEDEPVRLWRPLQWWGEERALSAVDPLFRRASPTYRDVLESWSPLEERGLLRVRLAAVEEWLEELEGSTLRRSQEG